MTTRLALTALATLLALLVGGTTTATTGAPTQTGAMNVPCCK